MTCSTLLLLFVPLCGALASNSAGWSAALCNTSADPRRPKLLSGTDAIIPGFRGAEGFWGVNQFDQPQTLSSRPPISEPKQCGTADRMGQSIPGAIQPGGGGQTTEQAVNADPNYAPAYLDLAHLAAESYSKKAVEFANTALEHDSKLVAAHEFLAYLALEDSDRSSSPRTKPRRALSYTEALDGWRSWARWIFWMGISSLRGWISC